MRVTAYTEKYRAAYGPAFFAAAYPAFDPSELPSDSFVARASPLPAGSAASSAAAMLATADGGVQRITDAQRFAPAAQIVGSVNDVANGAPTVPALAAPTSERIFLSIQNTHATQALFMAYDQPATTGSFTIQPGETRAFATFVPQNNIWLLGAGAATTFVIEFANKKAD